MPRAGTVPAAPPAAPPVSARRFDRSIVEGPLPSAVWRLAWPTVLTNVIGGLQGMIDHALVGNLVGYTANAAIGVSWQIFLVVIVFVSSMFMGMSVLVARFVGTQRLDDSPLILATSANRQWLPSAASDGAGYLVTNDPHLLSLNPYEGMQIVSMTEYYDVLVNAGLLER